jgi:hypothetical protein
MRIVPIRKMKIESLAENSGLKWADRLSDLLWSRFAQTRRKFTCILAPRLRHETPPRWSRCSVVGGVSAPAIAWSTAIGHGPDPSQIGLGPGPYGLGTSV